MAVIAQEDFETGTNGTVITTSNTIFVSPVVDSPVISTARSISGTRSMNCSTTTSRHPNVYWTDTVARALRWASFYMWFGSNPVSNTVIAQAGQAIGTIQSQLQLMTDGTIRMRNGVMAQWSSPVLTPSNWYRVSWLNRSSDSKQQAKIYLLHSGTPITGGDSGLQTYSGGTVNDFTFGSLVGMANLSLYLDRLILDNANEPAAFVTPLSVVVGSDKSSMPSTATANLTMTPSDGSGTKTYAWTIDSGPSLSTAQFGTPTAQNTTFNPSSVGTYVLRGTATDTTGSPFDTVTVTVTQAQAIVWTKVVLIGG
jgi:hypothetical protein